MSESLIFVNTKTYKNILKNKISGILAKFFWANCSFIMSDLSESFICHERPERLVAHLSWATWAFRSQSLICLERYERITHSRSFDLSEMREFPALVFSQNLFHHSIFRDWPTWCVLIVDSKQSIQHFWHLIWKVIEVMLFTFL